MVLPLVKLGSLAFRTLSKPIAARLKHNAGIHPKFRGFIIGIAQANHRLATNMQRRLYGRATDIHIRPLNEEKAIQAAADLLGELFVFSVAGAAIIYEVQRSARSEARKEEIRRQEVEAIKKRGEELAREVQIMRQRLAELERKLGVGFFQPFASSTLPRQHLQQHALVINNPQLLNYRDRSKLCFVMKRPNADRISQFLT